MSQSGKLTPNLDPESTKLLNLTVLQRSDPSIEEILMTAAHVALYEFSIDSGQWSRKDVEGSLFVVKRNTQPRFQFIVMNRRSADNLVENLTGDFEFEVQLPYLLYRNAAQDVSGIWFYNTREGEEVGKLFNRILKMYSKAPQNLKVFSNKSQFEELEASPRKSEMKGPHEPLAAVSSAIQTPQDQSLMNLFNASMNTGSNISSLPNSRYPHQTSTILPTSSITPTVTSVAAAPHVPSMPPPASGTRMPLHDASDPLHSSDRVANLVKPSSFFTPPSPSPSLAMPPFTPVSSSALTPAALHPPLNLQHPYGSPLLQPFPPPTPPPSLTPISTSPVSISKDKVRDALLMLVQDDQFVEMFYQALHKVNHT